MQTYPLAIPSAVLVLILLQLASPSWGAARDQQAIDAIAAGTRTEARASWWGFDPDDATGALQAAINSGAKRVIVDNVGKPWTVAKPLPSPATRSCSSKGGSRCLPRRAPSRAGPTACFGPS